jgi:hypothetical protein
VYLTVRHWQRQEYVLPACVFCRQITSVTPQQTQQRLACPSVKINDTIITCLYSEELATFTESNTKKKPLHLTLSHVRLTFQTHLLKSPERSHGKMEKPTYNTNTANGQKERQNE